MISSRKDNTTALPAGKPAGDDICLNAEKQSQHAKSTFKNNNKNNNKKKTVENSVDTEKPLKKSDNNPDHDKPAKKPRVKHRNDDLFCKGQRLRLYPNKKQAQLLRQWAGSSRYIWNWALNQSNEYEATYQEQRKNGDDLTDVRKTLGSSEISKRLTQLRQTEEFAWLNTVPRTVFTMTLKHLSQSFSAYYDGLTGKRAGEPPGKPKFKSRASSNDTVCFQIDHRHTCPLDWERHTLRIPGLGDIPVKISEPCAGDISSISVLNKGNKWFVSLTLINVSENDIQRNSVENNNNNGKNKIKTPATVYPDLQFKDNHNSVFEQKKGLASLDLSVVSGAVTTNDGTTTFSLFNQEVLRSNERHEQRKTKYQRVFSRKQEHLYNSHGIFRDKDGKWPEDLGTLLKEKQVKNSKNMDRIQQRIAVCDIKEVFRKTDAIHKFTTKLVKENHTIVVETLMLHAMAQTLSRGFRRRMHEACMGEIIRQLKYKCAWYNRSLIFADKWFPSSKRCSNTACHEKNKYLLLKDREWTCTVCNTKHVRDDTAAFNLWQEGWRLLEEFFQKNNINCLAAGSVVRGIHGVIFEALPVVKTPPKAKKSTLVSNSLLHDNA